MTAGPAVAVDAEGSVYAVDLSGFLAKYRVR
jgi:hypothetical protein